MLKLSLLVLLATIVSMGTAEAQTYRMRTSFYGPEAKGTLANGNHFDPSDPTVAACLILPLGTHIHVYNPLTKKGLHMIVQDKGPARSTGRQLDVSKRAAQLLGFVRRGVTTLLVDVEQ